MKKAFFSRIVIIGLAAAIIAVPALAQAGRGTARLGGVVVDKGGKPIEGATVTIVLNTAGSSVFETKTDKKGEWGFLGLGTGNYNVTVMAKGYIAANIGAYVRQLDRNPKVTITLEKEAAGSGLVQDEKTFELLEQGNQFYKDGKYDTALAMYEEFMGKNPGAYQVMLNIGDCYREKGEYDKAVEKYNKLVELSASDATMGKTLGAKGLAAIGLCLMKQGKIAESQDYFKKSIEMSPQDENLPYNVAEIYFSNQQIDEAIRYYEMANQIKPEWPDPYYRLAFAYLNKGDMVKAQENLEKFIKLEPENERSAQAKAILATIKK